MYLKLVYIEYGILEYVCMYGNMFVMCLEGVWKVPEGVWKVTVKCLECVWNVNLALIWQVRLFVVC